MNGEGFCEDAERKKKHTDQDKMDIKQGKGWKGKKERQRGVLVLCKWKVLSLTLAVGSIGTRKTMSGEEEEKKASNTAETGEETFTHRATRTAGSS